MSENEEDGSGLVFRTTDKGIARARRAMMAHGFGCVVGPAIPLTVSMMFPYFSATWLVVWVIIVGLTLAITLVVCYQTPETGNLATLSVEENAVVLTMQEKEKRVTMDQLKHLWLKNGLTPDLVNMTITLHDGTVYQILDPDNVDELHMWAEEVEATHDLKIVRRHSWRLTSHPAFPFVAYFLAVTMIGVVDGWFF